MRCFNSSPVPGILGNLCRRQARHCRSPRCRLTIGHRVHPRALYRVLRALASLGIFHEDEDGRFSLTPLAEPLRSDVPGSVRAFAVFMGSEWAWRSWGEIMHSVRTEKAAFEHVYGEPLFDHYAKHPDAARITMEGLTSRSVSENKAVVKAYNFSGSGTVVDIGGGQGMLLASILAANPGKTGILFEMSHVFRISVSASAANLSAAISSPRLSLEAISTS
jgi:hypothetical protein